MASLVVEVENVSSVSVVNETVRLTDGKSCPALAVSLIDTTSTLDGPTMPSRVTVTVAEPPSVTVDGLTEIVNAWHAAPARKGIKTRNRPAESTSAARDLEKFALDTPSRYQARNLTGRHV